MGNSTGKLANGLHLLRLAELLLERPLLGDVPTNRENAFLSRDVHEFSGIQGRPRFTRLRAKSDFQVTNRTTLVEPFHQPLALAPLPKFNLERCAANHLFAPVSRNPQELPVHIDLPAS